MLAHLNLARPGRGRRRLDQSEVGGRDFVERTEVENDLSIERHERILRCRDPTLPATVNFATRTLTGAACVRWRFRHRSATRPSHRPEQLVQQALVAGHGRDGRSRGADIGNRGGRNEAGWGARTGLAALSSGIDRVVACAVDIERRADGAGAGPAAMGPGAGGSGSGASGLRQSPSGKPAAGTP